MRVRRGKSALKIRPLRDSIINIDIIMDDSSFDSLKMALKMTPDNIPLLTLVLQTYAQKGEAERAYQLLISYGDDLRIPDDHALAFKIAASNACYLCQHYDSALSYAADQNAEILLIHAKSHLALGQKSQAKNAYDAAIALNSTLEDAEFNARLQSAVAESESDPRVSKLADYRKPKLTVISNDDTDASEILRMLSPPQETVLFKDIGGLDHVKNNIYKKIILPFQKPSLFQRFKKKIGGGILMYGPPGCGKTLLARATAGECRAKFFNISISDVLDMYIGESERKLNALFEKARHSAPSVMFFDEVEALGGKRANSRDSASSKLVSQFLSEMDGFAQNNHSVLILAATNVPWSVDPAFRRPGRFDRVIFVPPPDHVARHAILDGLIKDRPHDNNIDVDFIAGQTGGYSGADLRELVETAVDFAIEESLQQSEEMPITMGHLRSALKDVKPTTLEWLSTARNFARYSNESGQYDDVLSFLKKYGKN